MPPGPRISCFGFGRNPRLRAAIRHRRQRHADQRVTGRRPGDLLCRIVPIHRSEIRHRRSGRRVLDQIEHPLGLNFHLFAFLAVLQATPNKDPVNTPAPPDMAAAALAVTMRLSCT